MKVDKIKMQLLFCLNLCHVPRCCSFMTRAMESTMSTQCLWTHLRAEEVRSTRNKSISTSGRTAAGRTVLSNVEEVTHSHIVYAHANYDSWTHTHYHYHIMSCKTLSLWGNQGCLNSKIMLCCSNEIVFRNRIKINRIYISWSDIAEPSIVPHPSIRMHPSRSIRHQCHGTIYLFRATGPITSHQRILTSTLGYYLESLLISCKWSPVCSVRSVHLMAQSRSLQWFDDVRRYC